jgi:hypothetical protein
MAGGAAGALDFWQFLAAPLVVKRHRSANPLPLLSFDGRLHGLDQKNLSVL